MTGKLDPEERVLDSLFSEDEQSTDFNKSVVEKLRDVIATLEWDCHDNVVVEIGGTQVSGIDVGEEYNKKWQSPKGTRKYNKDAFIVIKNLSRSPFEPSLPLSEEHVPHHLKNDTSKT